MAKPNPMGNTFAERAAAAAGKASFTDPTPDAEDAEDNSTFASRRTAKKTSSKAVASGDAENKSVSSSSTRTKKK